MDRRDTLELHTSFTPSVSLIPQIKTAPPTATIPVAIAKAFAANIAEDGFTWDNADIMFKDALSGSAESVFSTERDEAGREAGRQREGDAVRLGGAGLRAICSPARCLRSMSSGMARARLLPINCVVESNVVLHGNKSLLDPMVVRRPVVSLVRRRRQLSSFTKEQEDLGRPLDELFAFITIPTHEVDRFVIMPKILYRV